MANRNFSSGGKIYSMHTMPVQLDCSFTVDVTQIPGISNLQGPTIQSVYMHSTNVAPASPNPASGTIVVRLQDNYNKLLALDSAVIIQPNSGTPLKIDNAAMTAGVAYTITVLGDASAAKWHAIGVPAGVTPAVGVSFVALSDGGSANVSTSRVQATAATGSGICSIEIVGDPNLSIAPNPTANQGYGAQIILQCRDYAGALAAPAAGSRIELKFLLSNSGVAQGNNQSV